MRTIKAKLYQFDELSEPAKERARRWWREGASEENFSLDEMLDSLKALFEAAGIRLKNWEIGPYSYSSVSFDMGEAGNLTGRRAMAWLENNLLAKLRISQTDFAQKRADYMSYGPYYRPGLIKPCPLTGVCYDEDLLEALQAQILNGVTLREAFHKLADKVRRLNEDELEYQNEDAQVDETIVANEYEFDEDGTRAQIK